MSEEADYLYALALQSQWNIKQSSDSSDVEETPLENPLIPARYKPRSNLDEEFLNRTQNLVHPMWETLDPTPDIFSMFTAFDDKFFQSRLKCVTLEWSKRMFSCAGICYTRRNLHGIEITIRLSEKLLKLRPRKDLVETLLHEMIHAYCYVLNIREGNGGHGPNFKKIMNAINKVAGTNISVYHSFHDEVDLYKQHWWRCNGSCQNRSPFYGYVKRSCNRAPGYRDQWWEAHLAACGGTFMKIREPEKPKKKTNNSSKENSKSAGTNLHKFFPTVPKQSDTSSNSKKVSGTSSSTSSTERHINGFDSMSRGNKGPVKTNGGGTLLLNSKTARPSTITSNSTSNESNLSIAKAFPPSSYPGLSTDPFNTGAATKNAAGAGQIGSAGGNLSNVRSLRDIDSNLNGGNSGSSMLTNKPNNSNNNMVGRGYALDSIDVASNENVKSSTDDTVDRKHLRNIWSKRFGGGGSVNDAAQTNVANKQPSIYGDETGQPKRRRLSTNINGDSAKRSNNWLQWDDDVMLKEPDNEIIIIHSDSDSDTAPAPPRKKVPLTADERQNAIKQEIMDEKIDLEDRDDIVLIDDEYDDNVDKDNISAAVELADTSIIDELFNNDTMLEEFLRENDVQPTTSRFIDCPSNDIITCPICQGKLKRSLLAEHLDGCTGIAVSVVPSIEVLRKLAKQPRGTKSNFKKPNTKKRVTPSSKKDVLRKAGYTEKDLANITSASDEDDFSYNSGLSNSSLLNQSADASVVYVEPDLENTRNYRQRNIYKTTRQCPSCAEEIEDSEIMDHIDECVKKRRH